MDGRYDPTQAAGLSAAAKFRNAGQNCTAPTRFFVARRIYDAFASAFAVAADAIPLGNGLDPNTRMGPLIHARRCDAIAALVDDAVSGGARLVAGGARLRSESNLFAPTVLADVPARARAMTEEPFGPLALIAPFDDLDDAIEQANATRYGLTGYGLTANPGVAERIASSLRVGMVGINSFALAFPEAPFGGVGESGYSREGGPDSLSTYRTTKFVHLAGFGL